MQNLIKITRVCKANNYEPKWHFRVDFLSPAISARMWFDSRLRHNAFRMPGLRTFRLPYHFIVASQWDGNPAFTVHTERYSVHAFRAAIKLKQCCYQGCAEGTWTRRRPRSSKEWNYKKCIYQNLVTRPGVQNFLWMLVSSAQQFLVAHTYKLCHTAFICTKYKR